MTKMLRLHQFGDINNLSLDDISLRELNENEVLLTIKAMGITGDNLNFIKGFVLPDENGSDSIFPATIGYEAAGIVEKVGEGVDADWMGKRVAPIGPYDFLKYGSLGEKAIVPANRLIEIPKVLTFEEAAALWVPYITAYPIKLYGNIMPGDFVTLTAGTSTVGHAAIQYVNALGGIPIVTTRSKEKAKSLKEATGIEHVIVTSEENYTERINDITKNKGTKLAFDSIGGEFVTDIAKGMSIGGMIIEYGVLGGFVAPLPVEQLISKGLTIKGFAVSEIVQDPKVLSTASLYILNQLEQNIFTPKIASTFPLAHYKEAFEQLIKNDIQGRIILTTERNSI